MEWLQVVHFCWSAFPFNHHVNWVDFQHASIVTANPFVPGIGNFIWIGVTSPTAIVVNHNIPFTRQTFWNHMCMVLTNNLTNTAAFSGAVIRT